MGNVAVAQQDPKKDSTCRWFIRHGGGSWLLIILPISPRPSRSMSCFVSFIISELAKTPFPKPCVGRHCHCHCKEGTTVGTPDRFTSFLLHLNSWSLPLRPLVESRCPSADWPAMAQATWGNWVKCCRFR